MIPCGWCSAAAPQERRTACPQAACAVPGLCGQGLSVSVLLSDRVHGERLGRRLGARVPVRAHGHHLHRQPVHHHRARRR